VKPFTLFAVIILLCHNAVSQYYIRGQISTSRGQRLPSVKIASKVGKLVYKSDLYGNFGFSSALPNDTLSFSCDGYDTLHLAVKTDQYARVIMRPLPSSVIFVNNNSTIIIHQKEQGSSKTIKQETYSHTSEYNFQQTVVAPGIAFSANINRASYSNIRRLINEMDGLLPPNAVRIEEMLNYFNFNYSNPVNDSVFHCNSYVTDCPWNKAHELLFLNISAKKISMANTPPANLVFLLDVSGSMDMPNKLPLIKSGFIKMIKNLRHTDTVSIITFGETIQVLIEGIAGTNKEAIANAIEKITADGNTPGEAGIKQAFKIARKQFIKGGNNRIILAADGDFNVGMNTEKDLMNLIQQEKQSGIYLSCLGVGSGNYKDSKLYAMAQKSNGNFAYIDNEQEAERVLVTDITKTLFTVAENVSISVHFNAGKTNQYRLLGYENDNTVVTDSVQKLKGGEIGSGHSLMAVFEIVPADTNTKADNWLAKMNVQYQLPLQTPAYSISHTCPDNPVSLKLADSSIRKAASVVMFGMKLKDTEYSKTISWRSLQKLASGCFNKDRYLDKEFLILVSKAKKMYTHRKKYGGE
jgi:Ca-activated chloride channel homolog